jgi:hypothetical protein
MLLVLWIFRIQYINKQLHSVKYSIILIIKCRSYLLRNTSRTLWSKYFWIGMFGFVFLCTGELPEDGSPVPKHVGFIHIMRIVCYALQFVAYYWLHLLVNILNLHRSPQRVLLQEFNDVTLILNSHKEYMAVPLWNSNISIFFRYLLDLKNNC